MKVFDGAKLRELRKQHELTQYDLSDKTDISQNRISDIERNTSAPTVDEIEVLSDALEVKSSHFLSDDKDIEVIKGTFCKKKKIESTSFSDAAKDASSAFEKLGQAMKSNQIELFVDSQLLGHDLSGYVLIRQETYQELLDNKSKLEQLQNLLS